MRPSRVACPSKARKVLIARAATPAPPVERPPRPCAFFPRADLPAAMSACIASTSRSVRLLTRRGPSSGLMWVSIRLRSIAMLVALMGQRLRPEKAALAGLLQIPVANIRHRHAVADGVSFR